MMAAAEDMLSQTMTMMMMPLMMPFIWGILFGMHPGELTRDLGSMPLGTSLP
jgi:hypothetical protein